jgi:dihydrofolate synthase/folylpolyglutamate synthase
MTPDLWLEKKFSGEFFTGRFEHLAKIVERFDLSSYQAKTITIAGTNGKGQTSRMLAKLLANHNYTYALWTSPHLKVVNERFVFNDKNIDDKNLLEVFKKVDSLELDLSYFEFLFISFLFLIKSIPTDFVILEVGLGGRLDATNVIDTDIAAVTSISRDHQAILGNSYLKILLEKLAISREARPLLTAFELKFLQENTSDYIRKNKIIWKDMFVAKELVKSDHFGKRNLVLAENIFELITKSKVTKRVTTDFQIMRDQLNYKGNQLMLFPSHNSDGLRKLVQFLSQAKYTKVNHVFMSFSKRDFKDLVAMCNTMLDIYDRNEIKLCIFNHSKAESSEVIHKLSDYTGIEVCADIKKFIEFQKDKDFIFTGSNYFLGHLIQRFS